MLNLFESIFLSILQGITEFLPVSSSGHLVIAQYFLGVHEPPIFFDIILHVATLFAVLVVFRKNAWNLLLAIPRFFSYVRNLFRKNRQSRPKDPEVWMLILICLSTVTTGAIGILGQNLFEKVFSNLLGVSFGLLLTGTLLFISQHRKKTSEKIVSQITLQDALFIGIAQGIAIWPGLSRSGTTISIGLLLGLNRSLAGEYSFLISIPAILGALILKGGEESSIPVSFLTLVLSFVVAFLVGWISLRYLLRWIRKGSLAPFAYYCWVVGFLLLLFSSIPSQ